MRSSLFKTNCIVGEWIVFNGFDRAQFRLAEAMRKRFACEYRTTLKGVSEFAVKVSAIMSLSNQNEKLTGMENTMHDDNKIEKTNYEEYSACFESKIYPKIGNIDATVTYPSSENHLLIRVACREIKSREIPREFFHEFAMNIFKRAEYDFRFASHDDERDVCFKGDKAQNLPKKKRAFELNKSKDQVAYSVPYMTIQKTGEPAHTVGGEQMKVIFKLETTLPKKALEALKSSLVWSGGDFFLKEFGKSFDYLKSRPNVSK